jgi:hypothetical protein
LTLPSSALPLFMSIKMPKFKCLYKNYLLVNTLHFMIQGYWDIMPVISFMK